MTKFSFDIEVKFLVGGPVDGRFVQLTAPISPWGGIDPETGAITDASHPENGTHLAGAIVLLPGLKGSTAAPGALLELIAACASPKAFVTPAPEIGLLAAAHAALWTLDTHPVIAIAPLRQCLMKSSAPINCRLVHAAELQRDPNAVH